MKFNKCHGLGNDYIFVEEPEIDLAQAARLAKNLCPRATGIGADGIVVLGEVKQASVTMRMVNADGSEGLICGNALRCVGLLGLRSGWLSDDALTVHTPVGRRVIRVVGGDTTEASVSVEMGQPKFGTSAIGVTATDPIQLAGPCGSMEWMAVSMGNPHVVGFVDDFDFNLEDWGPKISSHQTFPGGVNANFSKIESRSHLTSRIWERGSGATLACGSGACAGFAAARQQGFVDDNVIVSLALGDLHMSWSDNQEICMTGPATWVYSGSTDS